MKIPLIVVGRCVASLEEININFPPALWQQLTTAVLNSSLANLTVVRESSFCVSITSVRKLFTWVGKSLILIFFHFRHQ